jgi:predicted dehydrogenase
LRDTPSSPRGFYIEIIEAGKHLLGEKPFGIDEEANRAIMEAIKRNPDVLVRCSSEFPFFPGAYQLTKWVREGRFGRIIQVEAGFWHSSDLDPNKPMNWKRKIATKRRVRLYGGFWVYMFCISPYVSAGVQAMSALCLARCMTKGQINMAT